MILAQAVLPLFYLQVSTGYNAIVAKESKKGHSSATTSPTEKKKNTDSLIFHAHSKY